MAGPTVTLAFAGDSTSIEKTFAKVGSSAKEMAADLDKAEGKTKSFGTSMDTAANAAGNGEGAFMGTADVLDGLATTMGLNIGPQIDMARGFGDIAGGLSTLGPLIGQAIGKFGAMIGLTGAQAAATGTATASQWSLNAALAANPIGAVVIAIGLLVGGFILAWKHSETFRDIVRGALDVVKGAAVGLWNFFKDLPGNLAGIGGAIKDAVLWPYKTAFNAIARLWNSTVGRLSFSIPDWVPGLGGKGFSMPRLPEFHSGGVVPGPIGAPVLGILQGGETVLTRGQAAAAGSGPQTIILQVDGRELARVVTDQQRGNAARGFR